MSAKIKKSTTAVLNARSAKAVTNLRQLDEALATPVVVTTASNKATKKAVKEPREKAPKEDLMVFAFRLTKEESTAIHKAAGPGKASKFARTPIGQKPDALPSGVVLGHGVDAAPNAGEHLEEARQCARIRYEAGVARRQLCQLRSVVSVGQSVSR